VGKRDSDRHDGRLDQIAVTPWSDLEPGRVRAPGLLLVGATGRNSGKTEFVCNLISRYSAQMEVGAAKVTTVSHGETGCPRGGAGCGVCASLTQPYSVSTETGGPEGKDTVRMIGAGAKPVLWLRARTEHLDQGAKELTSMLPGISVVESNSVRKSLVPDLFVLVKGPGNEELKDSAKAVAHMADFLILSDGHSFTPAPGDISVLNGGWAVRREATAVVLAGGFSTRLGTNKALAASEQGMPMVELVARQVSQLATQTIISSNDPHLHQHLGLPVVKDRIPFMGPLMAIESCLSAADFDLCLVVPCDVPVVEPGVVAALFRYIGDADAAIPVTSDGRFHPTFALYRRSFRKAAKAALEAGRQRIVAAAEFGAHLRFVELPCAKIMNMNTVDDFRSFGRR